MATFLLRAHPAQRPPHFFLHHDAPTTLGTWHGDGFVVHNIFAMGVSITGVKLLAIAGGSAHQMPLATIRTQDLGVIAFLQGFDMLAGRILGASHKQSIAPLFDRQGMTTIRAGRTFEHFLYVATGWRQGADIVAGRIGGAAKKQAMFALTDHQLGATLRAGLALERMLMGREEVVIDF